MLNKKDDIILIEKVLSAFIPFYNEVITPNLLFNVTQSVQLSNQLTQIIQIIDNMSYSKKKKKNTFCQIKKTIKLEEKKFLYKTYLSSSDTGQNASKLFHENTLRITYINNQLLRGFTVLLREEISSNQEKKPLISKFNKIKKIVICETKTFEFRNLFILFEYIIHHFCSHLEEIVFEKVISTKLDQVETILKNGIYLHFLWRKEGISKYIFTNKIEFLNENVVFTLLYDYVVKNEIQDVTAEQIEINKINLINPLLYKRNTTYLCIKKIAIDKIKMLEELILFLEKNEEIEKVSIDKFISLPENYRGLFLKSLIHLSQKKLERIKICISSGSVQDLIFLVIIINCFNIRHLSLKINRVVIEEKDINSYIANIHKESKIEKIVLICEKINFNLENSLLFSILPNRLKYLTLGYVDHQVLSTLNKAIISQQFHMKLIYLKFYFVPINQENYEESFKELISIIENAKMINNIYLYNYHLKYKEVLDEGLKKAICNNINLKKLIIRSEKVFNSYTIYGIFYYEYPSFLTKQMLFIIKKHQLLHKLYTKKRILHHILSFFKIKKEKDICLSYQ